MVYLKVDFRTRCCSEPAGPSGGLALQDVKEKARPFLPQRHGAQMAVHFYRNIPPWWDLCPEKGSHAAPGPRTGTRGGCLVIQEGVNEEPPGRTSLLSLQDSTSTMKLQAACVVLQKCSVFQREGCDSSAWARMQ